MAILSRAVRNPGKINSSFESENFVSWSRMDSFGEPTHATFDFMVRPLRPAEATQASSLDGPDTPERARDPGGFDQIATTLSLAQVAIIQFNSDDADDPSIPGVQAMQRDSISFVLLAPVGSGTLIYFTDRRWNGTVLGAAGSPSILISLVGETTGCRCRCPPRYSRRSNMVGTQRATGAHITLSSATSPGSLPTGLPRTSPGGASAERSKPPSAR